VSVNNLNFFELITLGNIFFNLMDKKLTEFANSLLPKPDDITRGKAIFDRIVRTLHKNRKYKIDRAEILGSVGKGTVINTHLDFDCVVYLNPNHGEPPPQGDIFDMFEDCLTMAENIDAKIQQSHSKSDKRVALQATIDGFDFDIVPAVNYSQDPEKQRRIALEKIQSLPHPVKDGYRYSSSLSETQVDFVKKQSQFTHQLIRLAKYWMHSLLIKEYILGRSTLIELIAICASQVEASTVGKESSPFVLSTSPSMTRAFKQFLTCMSNFHQLNIIFQTPYYQQQDCKLNNGLCTQRPLVLDPSNPFNNFAFTVGKRQDLLRKIETMAAESLRRLEMANSDDPNVMEKLFSPQPAVTPDDLMGNLPKNMRVTVDKGSKPFFKRITKLNGGHIDHHGKMLLEHFIQDNINVQRLNMRSNESIQSNVQEIVNKQLFREARQWGPGGKSHEMHSMTIEIPCGTQTIRVSASW
jgi:hypothetical protein